MAQEGTDSLLTMPSSTNVSKFDLSINSHWIWNRLNKRISDDLLGPIIPKKTASTISSITLCRHARFNSSFSFFLNQRACPFPLTSIWCCHVKWHSRDSCLSGPNPIEPPQELQPWIHLCIAMQRSWQTFCLETRTRRRSTCSFVVRSFISFPSQYTMRGSSAWNSDFKWLAKLILCCGRLRWIEDRLMFSSLVSCPNEPAHTVNS